MDSKNLIIICVTAIICLAIVLLDADLWGSEDTETSHGIATIVKADLGFFEYYNTVTNQLFQEFYDLAWPFADGYAAVCPSFMQGDYYVIDGGLFRDDNQYLGGAGTYTFISGKNPYDGTSTGGDWYGKCTTHGWVKLDSDQHCPQCVDEGKDPRVLKNSKYQK